MLHNENISKQEVHLMKLNAVCSKTIAHILAYLRVDFLKNTKKVSPETIDITQSLGNNLKKARQNAGLSQEDVAEKLYYTRQAISRWELEKTNPNICVLIRLANLYKVDLNTIVTGIKLPEKRKIFYPFSLFGVLAFNSIFGLALLTLVVAFLFTVSALELSLLLLSVFWGSYLIQVRSLFLAVLPVLV